MPKRRHRSIRVKLAWLGIWSSAVAVGLACCGFVFFDVQTMRQAKVEQLQTQARMLAFNCTGALTFRDREAGRELLGVFRNQPGIEAACLYDAAGHPLATYGQASLLPDSHAPGLSQESLANDWQQTTFIQPIVEAGEPLGTLYVHAHLADLRTQIAQYAWIVASVMGLAMLVSIVLSARMAHRLADPVRRLSMTALRISQEHDYSLRVDVKGDGELADLCSAFNDMLRQIELSKAALRRSQESLEQRVEERTSRLVEEVTVRAAVQRDLERAKDSAESANRAKSEFLANMSHEIRTPLNGILGFTSLLLRGAAENEAERRDFLGTIHSSGEHLLNLLNDILDLSKIEAGQLAVERIACPTQSLFTDALSVLRARAQEKGLLLTHRWIGKLPETLQTDPHRLKQLLMNVVGNAIKFTARGGVEIVSQVDTTGTQPKLVIDVIDSGVGIPADKLKDIFLPFVQADTSVTRRFGGTGLGLTICRKLAVALGGSVSVRSEIGRGSTFTLTVDTGPLDDVQWLDASQVETQAPKIEAPSAPAANVDLTGARILLAEDGETNRKLLTLLLGRAGAQVTTAENGRLAVELVLRRTFDVVLMDMQMPLLDGYSAARAIRLEGLALPIIAITAHAMKGDEEKCRQAGCSGYLTKPIDTAKLLQTVAAALGRDAAGRDAAAVRPAAQPQASPPAPRAPAVNSLLDTSDPDFREIVDEFVSCLEEMLAAMQQAHLAGNRQSLASMAHRLKGTGGMAGFPQLTSAASALEQAVLAGEEAGVERHMRELAELADRIVGSNRAPMGAGTASHKL